MSDENFGIAILLTGAAFFGAIYMLPTLIAFVRGHSNRWLILVINSLTGATVIGWFGCLIWSMNAVHRSRTGVHGGESGLNLAVNDVRQVRVLDGDLAAYNAVDEIERLSRLRSENHISENEYVSLKRAILRRL